MQQQNERQKVDAESKENIFKLIYTELKCDCL